MIASEISDIRERSKRDDEIIVGSEVRQLCDAADSLTEVRDAWARIAGFAVCESCGPENRYRIVIDYPTLEQAQDAYRAMQEITEALR